VEGSWEPVKPAVASNIEDSANHKCQDGQRIEYYAHLAVRVCVISLVCSSKQSPRLKMSGVQPGETEAADFVR